MWSSNLAFLLGTLSLTLTDGNIVEKTTPDNHLPDSESETDYSSAKFDELMRETIADEFGEPVPTEFTSNAYYYYYFKAYDKDRNSKLDKSELLQVLVHLVIPSTSYDSYDNYDSYEPRRELTEDDSSSHLPWEIELICQDSVDRIMRKDDKNKDGFIDPLEYQQAKSRGLKAIKTAIDKQLNQHSAQGRFY